MRVLLAGLLVAVLFGPATLLIGIGMLMNPAAQATCPTGPGTLAVSDVPDRLATTTAEGAHVRLDHAQLTHAATILGVGDRLEGVGRAGVTVALMAALTESRLRMLANAAAYPSSTTFPNDGDGGDHDSLGLFQMRPSTGWGTVRELMTPDYQARAFFGGPAGPNDGSPRGLLDITGWESMPKGAVAQAVEVSAFPSRYATWEPVADQIIDALTSTPSTSGTVAETSRIVFPLPTGTWIRSSGFGMRRHPVTGVYKLHTGADYAAPAGTPISAAADGRVASAGPAAGYGNLILIEHTVNGHRVTSGYAHMYASGIHVRKGERVTAGQYIADVGMAGYTTGPHLHFEIRLGGAGGPLDPEPWLSRHGAAAQAASATIAGLGCALDPGREPSPFLGSRPDQRVDDPTTGGRVTARMAHTLAQIQARLPHSSWGCWRPGDPASNDHTAGRACDGTFGNSIGTRASGAALPEGWRAARWLQSNARALGVDYLIWQGRIWSLSRTSEGWRPYSGGGMFDPRSVTGGHYDHLHVTVR